jgi:hypothetical protein
MMQLEKMASDENYRNPSFEIAGLYADIIPENSDCQAVALIVISLLCFRLHRIPQMKSTVMNKGAASSFSAELTRSVCGMKQKPALMLGLKAVWHGQHEHLALINTLNITSADCLFHIR